MNRVKKSVTVYPLIYFHSRNSENDDQDKSYNQNKYQIDNFLNQNVKVYLYRNC